MILYRTNQIARVLSVAITLVGVSASEGFAFSSEAQQLCTADAFRLCGSEIPNISRIAACMHRQRAYVSPGCRAVMEREAGAARRAMRAAAD